MPIDAFHGDKKRTGVYGAFLLACYDSNNEEFQSSCEVGIGFSEAMLKPQRMFVRSPFKRDTPNANTSIVTGMQQQLQSIQLQLASWLLIMRFLFGFIA